MKTMIRVNAIKLSGAGDKSLSSMEAHGKRDDKTSKKRRVREVDPLVYGTLDLRSAYEAHVDGCMMNKNLTRPVLHALIKFPDEIKITPTSEAKMLALAVEFVNEKHGGKAVFAARLDRDEMGQHVVDVFFSPKYTKVTKNRKKERVETEWVSTTKFGKDLCEKHRAEIESRNDEGKFSTTPRSNGIALQTELTNYLIDKGLDIEPRKIKQTYGPDRLEIEAYKRVRDREDEANARLDAAELQIDRERAELDVRAARIGRSETKLKAFADSIITCAKTLCEMLDIQPPSKLHRMVTAIEVRMADMLRDKSLPEDLGEEPTFSPQL